MRNRCASLAVVLLAACTFDPSGPSLGGGNGDGPPIDPRDDGGAAGGDAGAPGSDGGGTFDAAVFPDAEVSAPDATVCPGTYVAGPTGCYRTVPVARRWLEVEANCEVDDGHLVVIGSAAENDHVNALLAGATGWIGATDRTVRGFVWVTRATATFTAWQRGEPNDGGPFSLRGEDCAETSPAGWNDKACGDNRPGVCEHDGLPADRTTY